MLQQGKPCVLCEGRPPPRGPAPPPPGPAPPPPGPAPPRGPPPRDFAGVLPVEMSERIFGELDAQSLVSAMLTCRTWNHIIQNCPALWRGQCQRLGGGRELEGARREGLPWKVVLVRNVGVWRLKGDWLRGVYSRLDSAELLTGRRMQPLDAESWGEILQAELDR